MNAPSLPASENRNFGHHPRVRTYCPFLGCHPACDAAAVHSLDQTAIWSLLSHRSAHVRSPRESLLSEQWRGMWHPPGNSLLTGNGSTTSLWWYESNCWQGTVVLPPSVLCVMYPTCVRLYTEPTKIIQTLDREEQRLYKMNCTDNRVILFALQTVKLYSFILMQLLRERYSNRQSFPRYVLTLFSVLCAPFPSQG